MCSNPICRSNPTSAYIFHDCRENDSDVVAQGLRYIADLGSSGRCPNLRALQALECPLDPHSIRHVILQHNPLVYWPCQEFPIGHSVFDTSAHQVHLRQLDTTKHPTLLGCYRPMPLRHEDYATAIEIIPRRVFRSSSTIITEGFQNLMLVFFFRNHSRETSEGSIVTLDFGPQQLTLGWQGHRFYIQWRASARSYFESTENHKGQNQVKSMVLHLEKGQVPECWCNGKRLRSEASGMSIMDRLSSEFSCQIGDSRRRDHASIFRVSHVAIVKDVPDVAAFHHQLRSCLSLPSLEVSAYFGGPASSPSHENVVDPFHLKALETCEAPERTTEYHVSSISGWSSNFVHGFQFHYAASNSSSSMNTDKQVRGYCFKGTHGTTDAMLRGFTFETGECLVALDGRAGAWMDGLTFHTNYGRTFELGGTGGGKFSGPTIPYGHEIRFVSAQVGSHVNNIRVFSSPSSIISSGRTIILSMFTFLKY